MTRNKKPRFFYGYCIVLAAFLALTAVASVGLILALLLGRSSGPRINCSKLGNKHTAA